ncbi:MAG: nucleotidyltransferase family protein [Nitrospinae bacterium]|nr:nucleotidyltransferase family protein [Nitrospinota bacterium]
MLQTKDNIILTIQRNQNQIRGFGVKRLGLFGSFVREEQNSESDIDLLVEFEPGKKTFDNLMRLYFVLKELFNQPIELVTTESLSPYIKPYIISEVEYADITP